MNKKEDLYPSIWWIQKSSTFANFYGITCREEAEAYLENKILNERLRKVCCIDAVLPNDIFAEWLNTAHYLIYCVRISLVLLSDVCGRKSKLCFYNLVVGES